MLGKPHCSQASANLRVLTEEQSLPGRSCHRLHARELARSPQLAMASAYHDNPDRHQHRLRHALHAGDVRAGAREEMACAPDRSRSRRGRVGGKTCDHGCCGDRPKTGDPRSAEAHLFGMELLSPGGSTDTSSPRFFSAPAKNAPQSCLRAVRDLLRLGLRLYLCFHRVDVRHYRPSESEHRVRLIRFIAGRFSSPDTIARRGFSATTGRPAQQDRDMSL